MTLKEGSVPSDASVRVEAPADLPGGYVLDVERNGLVFPVIIPEGGVLEGQTFQAELPLPQPIAPPSTDETVIVIPDDCVIPVPVQTPPELLSETPITSTTKFVVTNPDGTRTTTEETVHLDGTVVRTSITQSIGNTLNAAEQVTDARARTKVTYAHVQEGAWRTPLCECCNSGKCRKIPDICDLFLLIVIDLSTLYLLFYRHVLDGYVLHFHSDRPVDAKIETQFQWGSREL